MEKPKTFSLRRIDGATPPPMARRVQTQPRPVAQPKEEETNPNMTKIAKPRRSRRWRKRLLVGSAGLLGVVLVFLGIKFILATQKVITSNNDGGAPALAGDVSPSSLSQEGDSRINVLLLGIGGINHPGGTLADTIIVASVDPRTKHVAMLSLPRDMYVPIPGNGSTKINAAHAYGEQNKSRYPGGGPSLLKDTVEEVLDLPIHYFVRADFQGFKKAVDAVGGVDVTVDKAISDPNYPNDARPGQLSPFYLKAGRHHMNGDLALKYARSRMSTSDFDRASRQQKILVALKDKALSLGTLTNPKKIAGLIDSVGNNVRTDLQVGEIRQLVGMAKDIDSGQVKSEVLDASPKGLLQFGNIAGAGSILIPKAGLGNFSDIRAFTHKLFPDPYIKEENARVEVQNGTTRSGLAGEVAKLLKGYNYNVVDTVTADSQNYSETVIIDHTGGKKPYTINYLEKRFGVSARREKGNEGGPDITVVVGRSYQTPK